MLRVTIDINGHIIGQLHAVRTKPKSKSVEKGTICKYNIVYEGQVVGNMEGEYGCGVDLAMELLKVWKENGEMYKTISLYKKIEEMNNDG